MPPRHVRDRAEPGLRLLHLGRPDPAAADRGPRRRGARLAVADPAIPRCDRARGDARHRPRRPPSRGRHAHRRRHRGDGGGLHRFHLLFTFVEEGQPRFGLIVGDVFEVLGQHPTGRHGDPGGLRCGHLVTTCVLEIVEL